MNGHRHSPWPKPEPLPPLKAPQPERFDPVPLLAAGIFFACAVVMIGIGFYR